MHDAPQSLHLAVSPLFTFRFLKTLLSLTSVSDLRTSGEAMPAAEQLLHLLLLQIHLSWGFCLQAGIVMLDDISLSGETDPSVKVNPHPVYMLS